MTVLRPGGQARPAAYRSLRLKGPICLYSVSSQREIDSQFAFDTRAMIRYVGGRRRRPSWRLAINWRVHGITTVPITHAAAWVATKADHWPKWANIHTHTHTGYDQHPDISTLSSHSILWLFEFVGWFVRSFVTLLLWFLENHKSGSREIWHMFSINVDIKRSRS